MGCDIHQDGPFPLGPPDVCTQELFTSKNVFYPETHPEKSLPQIRTKRPLCA